MDNYRSYAALILAFFISFYALFGIGHFAGDGYGDFLTAKAIVMNRSLSLGGASVNIDELDYGSNITTRGRDGRLYNSRSSVGMAIILSVFYLIGHIVSWFFKGLPHDFITMFFVSFANPVLLALACLLVFLVALRLGFLPRTSCILALIYGLGTMVPPYARTGFSEPALLLFLLSCVYLLLKYRDSGENIFLFLSALSMAYAVVIRPNALMFIPCFAVYAAWLIRRKGKNTNSPAGYAVYFITLGPSLLLIGIFNWYVYGGLLKFGGRDAVETGRHIISSSHFLKGLYYYLFSTGKGFFLFNLPLIFAFIGLSRIPGKRRAEAALFAAIFLVNLLFFVKFFKRGSLFSWGPRYLLPSATVLMFFVGDFIENYKNRIARITLLAASLTGFFIMLPCMFINQSKFYFFVKEKLGLPEYMVNFIPDLSPILGAWRMFLSRAVFALSGREALFIYSPDYRMIPPVAAGMEGYNYFDSWFLKIYNYSPHYLPIAYAALVLLISLSLSLFLVILKDIIGAKRSPCRGG